MSHILSIETALPGYRATHDEIVAASRKWLGESSEAAEVFTRFLSTVKIEERYFVVPPASIISLGGGKERAAIFEREAPVLGYQAASLAIRNSGISPGEIDAIIFTSCSCPVIPSVDTRLVEMLGLRPDILRIPVYQAGCAGGVWGLGLAHQMSLTLRNVLLVSVELCSLVFQAGNHSTSHLVGAALFGDGAAAAVVSREKGGALSLLSRHSKLLPETRHLMGYDLLDTGAHLRLDKSLPQALGSAAPLAINEFLSQNNLQKGDVPWWIFHPGSVKILNSLIEVIQLSPWQAPWAERVLWKVGNMSSATILYVLKEFLADGVAQNGDRVGIVGIGPGLTIESLLAEVTRA